MNDEKLYRYALQGIVFRIRKAEASGRLTRMSEHPEDFREGYPEQALAYYEELWQDFREISKVTKVTMQHPPRYHHYKINKI